VEEGRVVGPMEASQSVAKLSPATPGGRWNEVARNARHTFPIRYSEVQQSQAPPSYHGVNTEHPAYMRA